MPAKKLKPELLTLVELKKFEDKLNEFQTYLQQNTLVSKISLTDGDIKLDEAPALQDILHREIAIQIKMQDAILSWLPVLEKLKQGDAATKVETRGNVEVNGLFNSKNNNAK